MYKDDSWDIVVYNSVTSNTPILKKVGDTYKWAISPLSLSYTLSDKTTTYNGNTQNLSDFYTNVFGADYSFINAYKFQKDSADVTGYKNAETYSSIKVASNSDFLTIASGTDGTLTINKKDLTAITGITAENKTYNGNTDATLVTSSAGFTGIITGDTLTVASATGAFSDKNTGEGKTVNISGLALGGADASNYNLTDTTATTTANISKKALTITGLNADNKTYDSTTNVTISNWGSLDGLIGTETLTLGHGTASFDTANVGNGKTVTAIGYTLGNGDNGGDVNNYLLATATTTANITAAPTPTPVVTPPVVVVPPVVTPPVVVAPPVVTPPVIVAPPVVTPPVVVAPQPTPTPITPPTPQKHNNTGDILTPIINGIQTTVQVPNILVNLLATKAPSVTPSLAMQQANTNLATNFGVQTDSVQITSIAAKGEEANALVTLSEIKEAMGDSTQDVRVPFAYNSIIDLVNGGVHLPEGVDQQFYVTKTPKKKSN